MRNALKIVGLALLMSPLTIAGSNSALAEANKTHSVVELFTSQGCSSCPPADRVLSELADKQGILALSLHVDYWDYLGWRDTFGKAEHSDRQRGYALSRNDRNVYTPQAVVNGRNHIVGSRRGAIDQAIRNPQIGSLPVSLDISKSSTALEITVGDGAEPAGDTSLWLVFFNDSETVKIERGENRGETITYHNVVREMRPIGMWKGSSMSVELPLSELTKAGYDNCAVLLQSTKNGYPGPILGAAVLSDQGLRM